MMSPALLVLLVFNHGGVAEWELDRLATLSLACFQLWSIPQILYPALSLACFQLALGVWFFVFPYLGWLLVLLVFNELNASIHSLYDPILSLSLACFQLELVRPVLGLDADVSESCLFSTRRLLPGRLPDRVFSRS